MIKYGDLGYQDDVVLFLFENEDDNNSIVDNYKSI